MINTNYVKMLWERRRNVWMYLQLKKVMHML